MKISKYKNKIKNKKKIQETKLHAIPRFPAGSFAVHIGDHLRCSAAPAYPYFTVSRHVANLQLDTSNLQLGTSILQLDTSILQLDR